MLGDKGGIAPIIALFKEADQCVRADRGGGGGGGEYLQAMSTFTLCFLSNM